MCCQFNCDNSSKGKGDAAVLCNAVKGAVTSKGQYTNVLFFVRIVENLFVYMYMYMYCTVHAVMWFAFVCRDESQITTVYSPQPGDTRLA